MLRGDSPWRMSPSMADGASDLTHSRFRLHELGPYIGLYTPNPEPAFALPFPPPSPHPYPIPPLLPVNIGLLHSTNSVFTLQDCTGHQVYHAVSKRSLPFARVHTCNADDIPGLHEACTDVPV